MIQVNAFVGNRRNVLQLKVMEQKIKFCMVLLVLVSYHAVGLDISHNATAWRKYLKAPERYKYQINYWILFIYN